MANVAWVQRESVAEWMRALESERPGSESRLRHLTSVWPWNNHLSFLSLSFSACQMLISQSREVVRLGGV